jgi:hypothetical protein
MKTRALDASGDPMPKYNNYTNQLNSRHKVNREDKYIKA